MKTCAPDTFRMRPSMTCLSRKRPSASCQSAMRCDTICYHAMGQNAELHNVSFVAQPRAAVMQQLVLCNIHVEHGRVAHIKAPDADTLVGCQAVDLEGGCVTSTFVDLHTHIGARACRQKRCALRMQGRCTVGTLWTPKHF